MSSLRRIIVSFVVLFDILAFGLIFVIMSNTSAEGDLIYMAESDGVLTSVLSLLGIMANVVLALLIFRGRLEERQRDAGPDPGRRTRITGE